MEWDYAGVMRTYVRTSPSTGVSFGPIGAIIYVIGLLFYAALWLAVAAVALLVAAGMWAVREVRERKAARVASPVSLPR